MLPGPRQSRCHTNDTTTPTIHHAPHRVALRGRAMHCPTTTRPSEKLRDHRRCSSGINQVEFNTLTTDQSRVKEKHTLQIRVSRLPSAGLSRFMNTLAQTGTEFNENIVAHRACAFSPGSMKFQEL